MHACRIFIDRCEYDASALLLPRTVGRPADARGADGSSTSSSSSSSMKFSSSSKSKGSTSAGAGGGAALAAVAAAADGGGGGGGGVPADEAEPPNETRRRAAELDAPRLKGDDDDFLPSQGGGEALDGGAIWEAEQPIVRRSCCAALAVKSVFAG